MKKRILMSLSGVIICAISVGVFKLAAFGVDPFQVSKYISRRKQDFVQGLIVDCYVVYSGAAIRVNAADQTRMEIEGEIEILKP